MRGEQSLAPQARLSSFGSPPLARGTAVRIIAAALSKGITPACAGNRSTQGAKSPWRRDHPRLRGEQHWRNCAEGNAGGSPPLARGTAAARLRKSRPQRITPACAGNSKAPAKRRNVGGDHPRLRGEQEYAGREKPVAEGSPPLARGTATFSGGVYEAQRITPACAGNSSSSAACAVGT